MDKTTCLKTQRKILTRKLDLTGPQQAKIQSIPGALHDATENRAGSGVAMATGG